jgi:hypothetical protein
MEPQHQHRTLAVHGLEERYLLVSQNVLKGTNVQIILIFAITVE